MTMIRKGCIYKDTSSKGLSKSRSANGGNITDYRHPRHNRWCAEISYRGKRYRCRSYYFYKVRAWLDDACEKFND